MNANMSQTENPTQIALRPLPMRVTQYQFARLQALRDRDDIAIQEHIRRAIDEYLDRKAVPAPDLKPAKKQPGQRKARLPDIPGDRLPKGFAQTPPPGAVKATAKNPRPATSEPDTSQSEHWDPRKVPKSRLKPRIMFK